MNDSDFIQVIEEVEWLSKADHISTVLNTTYRWDWLPSSRDQNNPFPVDIQDSNKEIAKELSSKACKAALISLRKVGLENPLLLDNSHNYTEAFKGAALFCIRLSAKEYTAGQKGKWPCGIQEGGNWVVM
jgi:hypothetical protein